MDDPRCDDANPYESPQSGADVAITQELDDQAVVKKFHDLIDALGVLWVLFGGLLALGVVPFAGIAWLLGGGESVLWYLAKGLGAALFISGAFTCLHQRWAVYTGLVLAYIAAIGLGPCSTVVLVPVIFHAHWVLRWAREMRARGLPL